MEPPSSLQPFPTDAEESGEQGQFRTIGFKMATNADRDGAPHLPISELTARQLEVATLLTRSWSNRQIAQELNLKEGSVRIFLHRIYRKLNVANRTELALLISRALRD
jgi:DNA-binding NarL/FixJ family response regulator